MRTILTSFLLGISALAAQVDAQELRGVWIANTGSTVLESRAEIAQTMEVLRAHGINTVYPVMWSKGLTCYPSAVAKEVVGSAIDPRYGDRDPLEQVIYEAHRRGIEVVAWLEYGFAAEHAKKPTTLLKRNPKWAAVGPDGKRVEKNDFTWANAFDPEVQSFVTDMVVELAQAYDIDGLQGDDRLPALPSTGGYDAATLKAWAQHSGSTKKPEPKDEAWVAWRADRLSDWLAQLQTTVRGFGGLQLSSSPSCYPWGLNEYLQDAQAWAERGLVDALHPQVYRYDLPAYVRTLREQTSALQRRDGPLLAPGVLVKSGSYVISSEYLLGAVQANRDAGCAGEVHFFLEGLRERDDALLKALHAGPYRTEALAPWRVAKPRPAPREALLDADGRAELTVQQTGQWDLWIDLGGLGPAKTNAAQQVEISWTLAGVSGSQRVRVHEGLARVTRLQVPANAGVSVQVRAAAKAPAGTPGRAVLLATREMLAK